MNMVAVIKSDASPSLTVLIDRAAKALSSARTAAEILDARDRANVAYTAAKLTARLAKAKKAHDAVVAAAFRAQADALDIEAQAKRRLADEYDAAQARGEFRTRADNQASYSAEKSSLKDAGITDVQMHEARRIRDAEKRDPGIVRRTVDEAINAGREPTKADVRKATAKMVPKKPAKKASAAPINQHVNKLTSDLTDASDSLEAFIDKRGAQLDADGYHSIFQHIELVVKQLQALAYDRITKRLEAMES